jgi:hypothetical protein
LARVLFITYSVVAAAILITAMILSASFFAHFQTVYSYSTPITTDDLLSMLLRFRPADMFTSGYDAVLLLSVLATLGVVIHSRSPSWVRVAALLPQLPLLVLAPLGLLALASDLAFPRDGEWLHEGWPVIEAAGIWASVPLITTLSLLRPSSQRFEGTADARWTKI